MSYDADVAYEIWRRGGNPDSVHPDRIAYYQGEGYEAEQAAAAILRRQREAREARRMEEQQEREYYEQMECEHYESLARQQAEFDLNEPSGVKG